MAVWKRRYGNGGMEMTIIKNIYFLPPTCQAVFDVFKLTDDDAMKFLVCELHYGTKKAFTSSTFAKSVVQRDVLKFSAHPQIGVSPIVDRFMAGSLTNQIQKIFKVFSLASKIAKGGLTNWNRVCSGVRPAVDLEVCEASYVNTPVIAVANTDSSFKFVDIVIPSNNKGFHESGLGRLAEPVKLGFEVPHITDWAAASSGLGAALVKPLPQAQHPVWSLCLRRRLHRHSRFNCISAKADSAQLPSIVRYSFAIFGYDPNQSTKTAKATTTAGVMRSLLHALGISRSCVIEEPNIDIKN
ncbi:hypothetical protein niasHT_003369 [Heterodera trifolii]|uniref:40S ribosomal protein SA n=1 Tax=Heterodera trifolii TaxID=157864 RepID=A0ABD2LQA9_9BILA